MIQSRQTHREGRVRRKQKDTLSKYRPQPIIIYYEKLVILISTVSNRTKQMKRQKKLVIKLMAGSSLKIDFLWKFLTLVIIFGPFIIKCNSMGLNCFTAPPIETSTASFIKTFDYSKRPPIIKRCHDFAYSSVYQ